MTFILSKEAEVDLENICIYAYENFGEQQAENHYHALEDKLDSLSRIPTLGRNFGLIKSGLKPSPYTQLYK